GVVLSGMRARSWTTGLERTDGLRISYVATQQMSEGEPRQCLKRQFEKLMLTPVFFTGTRAETPDRHFADTPGRLARRGARSGRASEPWRVRGTARLDRPGDRQRLSLLPRRSHRAAPSVFVSRDAGPSWPSCWPGKEGVSAFL